jgi:ACS family sodium-dependent inorganic phosphate cotransporter
MIQENDRTSLLIDGDATNTSVGWPMRYTVVGLAFCAAFICYIDRVNLSVAVIPMQKAFGWSETTKGLVLSSFFIGYMLFQIPGGYLSNRWGGKVMLGAAVTWWSVFTLVTPAAAATSMPLLIAARIGLGLGEGAMFPAAYSLFGRWVPTAERSRAVSLLLSGVPLGTLFALGTTGWLVTSWGWSAPFYLFGVVGLIWALIWGRAIHDDPARHPRISDSELALIRSGGVVTQARTQVPWRLLLTAPAAWALILNHFCSNWVLYMLLAWLPSYFHGAQGLDTGKAGLFAAAPWLTMFVMVNVSGALADGLIRRGASLTVVRKLMQTAGLVGSAVFLMLAKDAGSANAALGLMCGALGMLACTWSGMMPNHLEIAPRYADVLMGITNTAATIPGIIGVAATGWLVEVTGTYASAFVLAAVINVFGAIIWLLFGTSRRVVD